MIPEFSEEPVGVVFDHGDATRSGHLADDIHLAADARVVHHDNRACSRRNQPFELPFVEAKRAGMHVAEHGTRATNHEGVDAGHKCERGHDDFVAGLDVEQERRHLEGMGA